MLTQQTHRIWKYDDHLLTYSQRKLKINNRMLAIKELKFHVITVAYPREEGQEAIPPPNLWKIVQPLRNCCRQFIKINLRATRWLQWHSDFTKFNFGWILPVWWSQLCLKQIRPEDDGGLFVPHIAFPNSASNALLVPVLPAHVMLLLTSPWALTAHAENV